MRRNSATARARGRSRSSALLAALAVVVSACGGGGSVAGKSTVTHPAPFVVALATRTAEPAQALDFTFCGGVLVAPTIVATAAHCVTQQRLHNIVALVGARDLCASHTGVGVKRIVISPAYDEQTSDADVALLELQHAVVEAPVATAADVSGWSGRTATAYGWGDFTNVGARPCALGQATLRVVDTRTCARELARDDAGPISLTSSMCAAPLRSGGEDVCHGDSGGPLVGDDDGHPALLGVVSWGEGCRTGRPGVFASATAVRDLLRIVDRE